MDYYELNEYLESTCGRCDNSHLSVCPKCGGKMVRIVYGEPTEELIEAAERGEVILGGCCIIADENGSVTSPEWGCINCNKRF
jgi:hypothetical protein